MPHKRSRGLLITLCLCMLLSSCTRSIVKEYPRVITLAPPDIYPARVYPLQHRRACIDMGVNGPPPQATAFAMDASRMAQNPEVFAYQNARGEKRFCACLDIRPDMKPGAYDIPVTATFPGGVTASTLAHVEVAAPAPAVGDAPTKEGSQAALEAATGSHPASGNRVEILDNGTQAFTAWFDLLASAKKTIRLQTFFLGNRGQCAKLVALLKSKASKGVDVRLIITRYPELSLAPLSSVDLKAHGIKVLLIGNIGFPRKVYAKVTPWYLKMQEDYRIFKTAPDENPFRQWAEKQGRGQLMIDYALHEKMLIVDGKEAIVGGRNLSDNSFFWWKDLDMLLAGPIVDEVDRAFRKNWHTFSGHELPAGQPRETAAYRPGIPARLVQSRPWDGAYTNLDALVRAIDAAHARVFITSQYLVLPDKLRDSLCAAALRGVDVRILTNSLETGGEVALSLCHYLSLNYYGELLRAGVRIYEYTCDPRQKRKPYVHAKEVMLDGSCTAIGSFNLSLRSAYLESELMVYLFDTTLTKNREENFLANLARHGHEVIFSELARKEQTFGRLMGMARLVEILY